MRRHVGGLILALVSSAAPAAAEVHFGSNVFIGGHDFSHQSYNRHHRLACNSTTAPSAAAAA